MPLGYFFLEEPPRESFPIPDFRSGRRRSQQPSAELLDSILHNQQRQQWYEEYLNTLGADHFKEFVGSAADLPVHDAAAIIAKVLEYSVEDRAVLSGAGDARSYLAEKFEALGGLVVFNSMVKNNTSRMLDIDEFRGFSLHSRKAPLVFVNANDTKNGQVFSLLHEFAHIWRGQAGVSDGGEPNADRENSVEKWCDGVAAQIAVPDFDLRLQFNASETLSSELDRLSKRYLCSTLVILQKLRAIRAFGQEEFNQAYQLELARVLRSKEKTRSSGGGDFYNNQRFRIGQTLSRAITRSVNLGTTSMTEGLALLGFKSTYQFDRYAERIGMN